MPETTPLIKAALNLRVGAGFDLYGMSVNGSPFTIFLILYITLLRRAPGYDESIRWELRLWPSAGIWAGNLLNILLYIPLGWTAARAQRQRNWFQLLASGAALSVFCECVQHLTARGCADVNDVVWNVVGMGIGVALSRMLS